MNNGNESGKVAWPQKTTELYHNHFDSTLWNDFPFRDDDIIISTYGKSGTTWVQQIVGQLLFAGAEGVNTAEMSPWVDLRIPPWDEKIAAIEAQTHRRFLNCEPERGRCQNVPELPETRPRSGPIQLPWDRTA